MPHNVKAPLRVASASSLLIGLIGLFLEFHVRTDAPVLVKGLVWFLVVTSFGASALFFAGSVDPGRPTP